MNENIDENRNLSFWAAMGMVALCMFFGANAVAIKVSLKGIGALTAVGLRCGIATVSIIFWAYLTDRKILPKKNQLSQIFIFFPFSFSLS